MYTTLERELQNENPNAFFLFWDILDEKKTEPVHAKKPVLLMQNVGWWKIIKIWLKMTTQNHEKRHFKTSQKNILFLTFFVYKPSKNRAPVWAR